MSPGFTAVDNDTVIARLPEIDGTAVKVYLAIATTPMRRGRAGPARQRSHGRPVCRKATIEPARRPKHPGRLEKLGLIRIERQRAAGGLSY